VRPITGEFANESIWFYYFGLEMIKLTFFMAISEEIYS